ncbi:cytochrome oxidase putative small subunit CydP [Parvibaculum sp.]|uniref:cytochrome oxidase putative small subunit CydP n=1 Tax=Parvibaculum sp. TaxID=2024848 RepID=UPI00320D891C
MALNSLRADIATRLHPLVREIGLVLVFKLVALLLLYTFFFGPSHRVHVTPDGAHSAVFGPHTTSPADPLSRPGG